MGNFIQQTIPVADWVESFTDWLTGTFSGLFPHCSLLVSS